MNFIGRHSQAEGPVPAMSSPRGGMSLAPRRGHSDAKSVVLTKRNSPETTEGFTPVGWRTPVRRAQPFNEVDFN